MLFVKYISQVTFTDYNIIFTNSTVDINYEPK